MKTIDPLFDKSRNTEYKAGDNKHPLRFQLPPNYTWDGQNLIMGDGNKNMDNLKECINTYIVMFWHDMQSGAFYCVNEFFQYDFRETIKLFVEQGNKPSDNVTLEMLECNSRIYPASECYKKKYSKAMTEWCEIKHKKYEVPPLVTFKNVMRMLKHESVQDEFRASCRKEGLMPMYINVI